MVVYLLGLLSGSIKHPISFLPKIKVTNRPGKLSEQRCRNQTHLILQNIVEQNLRVESVPQNFVNCREMVTLNLLLQKYYLPITIPFSEPFQNMKIPYLKVKNET